VGQWGSAGWSVLSSGVHPLGAPRPLRGCEHVPRVLLRGRAPGWGGPSAPGSGGGWSPGRGVLEPGGDVGCPRHWVRGCEIGVSRTLDPWVGGCQMWGEQDPRPLGRWVPDGSGQDPRPLGRWVPVLWVHGCRTGGVQDPKPLDTWVPDGGRAGP